MAKVVSVRKVSDTPLRVGDIRMGSPDNLYLLENVAVHNSSIVNINIAMGCPSFCSFCKEALIGREYTEFNALESTGYVKIEIEGEIREYPAKTSVKFYDPEVGHIVYGPIQVPIAYGYPIAQDSLAKLRSGLLGRLSAD